MKRRTTWMGLLLGTALLAMGSTGIASAQDYGEPPNAGDRWQRYQDGDQSRGAQPYQDREQNRGWQQDRGWFAQTNLEGRWREQGSNGRDGRDFGRDDAYGPRRMLPSFLQINQSRRQVQITDFRGRTLQTIQIGNRQRWFWDSDVLTGRWRGRALEVQRTTPRGGQMIQTFSVQDRGQTLVIHTRIDNGQSNRDLEFDRVYQRS